MRNKHFVLLLSVIGALTAVAVVVSAGNPDNPPGPPETTSSYTLEHIYNRLDTGAAGTPITFTEPISGPTVGTMHTLDEIYNLIGERAFVPQTGQTISYTVGDDGDLEMGIDWIAGTRFITGTTGVVTDTLTGLVWLENANCAGGMNFWSIALSDVAQLNTNGQMNSNDCGDTSNGGSHQTDWRLPNVRELQSLIDYGEYDPALPSGHPFANVQLYGYWSSTTGANNTSAAWVVYLTFGNLSSIIKTTNTYYVWPVRGGQ